jgi:hypothetical protein
MHGFRTHHWRGFSAQRRRVVSPAVLRGTRADCIGAGGLRASALSAIRAASHCVHCLRAADRACARGNRYGTRQASYRSYSRPQGLGAPFGRMDEADRPEDRRASASQSRANAMHWMRMSFDRQMRVCKSSRSSRAPGTWAALLARLSSPGTAVATCAAR